MDLRCLKVPRDSIRSSEFAKSKIISYLGQLYESVAECLPDSRDDPMDETTVVSLNLPEMEDPYGQFDKIKAKTEKQKEAVYGLPSGARPRKPKHRSRVTVVADPGAEERFLPPGHMVDYYHQYCHSHPNDKVDFSSFWRVWYSHFPYMKFRHETSHSVCSVCVHSKLLIAEMSGFLKAREEQRKLLIKHLGAQYRDRTEYWRGRGLSRLRNHGFIQLIIDSMDQQKFCYPRKSLYNSKELSTFVRPRAHCTAVICHGFFVLVLFAEHSLPKNASCMVEILAYCMQLLQSKHHVNLAEAELAIQSDNTVRECKNNILLRWLASITANGFFGSVMFV